MGTQEHWYVRIHLRTPEHQCAHIHMEKPENRCVRIHVETPEHWCAHIRVGTPGHWCAYMHVGTPVCTHTCGNLCGKSVVKVVDCEVWFKIQAAFKQRFGKN